MMYDLIIYKAITNPYFRIVRVIDGAIMTTLTGALSVATTWATTYTTMAVVTVIGGMPITIPQGLDSGEYDLLIYDDATPANDDKPAFGFRIVWDGTKIMSIRNLDNVYV